jgi:hypothetical protein
MPPLVAQHASYFKSLNSGKTHNIATASYQALVLVPISELGSIGENPNTKIYQYIK